MPEHDFRPRDAAEVERAIQWALGEGKTLEVVGRGSKRAIGRAAQWDATLDLSALSGVTLYEPEELVLSAKAGTPLAEIEALVAASRQELAFEPMDHAAVLGVTAGSGQHRWSAGSQSFWPAAHQGRRGARSFSRRYRGIRPRRDLQVGWPRRQERHRLRHLQASCRLVGYARRHDRRNHQNLAAGRDRGDGSGPETRRCHGAESYDCRDRFIRRCLGGGASARNRCRAYSRNRSGAGRRDRVSPRGRRSVGHRTQEGAGKAARALRHTRFARRGLITGAVARGA